MNRSVLVRKALRDYLDRQELLDLERRDAAGYAQQPDTDRELLGWEKVFRAAPRR